MTPKTYSAAKSNVVRVLSDFEGRQFYLEVTKASAIDTRLKDKVVIVTGANHGIGAALATASAEESAKVFVDYFRRSAEANACISKDEASKDSANVGRNGKQRRPEGSRIPNRRYLRPDRAIVNTKRV